MRPRSSPEGTPTRQTRPSASYKHTWHLKLAQEGLIELQEGSKMTPGWLKMVSSWFQDVPRWFQDAQDDPMLAQDGLKMVQDGAKMPQDRPILA